MRFQSNTRVLSFLQAFVNFTSIVVSGIGLLVLLGWITDIPRLMSILPGLPVVRFNTALCLLLLGISAWLLQNEEASTARKRIGKSTAGLALLISLMTLAEYVFRRNLGIDELFVTDIYSSTDLFPGRMSPIAILYSGFSGTALLLMGSRIDQYFSLSVFVLSIVGIMDFLFGFPSLFRNPQNTYSAVQVAGAFLFLSLAMLAARPTQGMMKILSSDLPGSKAMRLLLPGIVILTLLMGWLVERAETRGVLDTSKESIFLVLLLTFIYSPLIYSIAQNINRAEERIIYLNRLYATLSQVNQTIVRVHSQQELFENICSVAMDFGGFQLAWIGLFNTETGYVTPVGAHGSKGNLLPFQQINIKGMPFEQGLIGLVLRSGLAQFSQNIEVDPRMAHWRDIVVRDGYHSAAAIPIRQRGEVIGLLNLYSADIGFFTLQEEQNLLEKMGQDISFALDMIATETERRLVEERFASTFHSSPTSLTITRVRDGTIVDVNDAWCNVFGYTREQAMGRTSVELAITNEQTRQQIMATLKANGLIRNLEAGIRTRSGGERDMLLSMEMIEINGESHALTTLIDITERKNAEHKLQRQNQRLKILREIDTAILAADSLENIVGTALSHIRELTDCRRASISLFDWGTNEALIFNVSMTGETSVPEGTRMPLTLFQDMIQTLAKNQRVLINDLNALADPPPQIQSHIRNGLHSMCLLPLFSQNRLIGSFSLFSEIPNFFDEEKISLGREVANQVAIAISQRDLIEDLRILNAELEQRIAERTADLRRTNSELEQANRTKSDFLATMSHELRTPLNSILGLSESLLEQRRGSLNDHQQKALHTVAASGRHLLNLITDILEFSKLEAGKLNIHPETIGIKEVCESSLSFVREQALRKSISLEFQSDPSVLTVYADPQRLKQILVNLLNNAVKFTPENKSVCLDIHLNAERDQIHFSVIDQGIGIATDDLKKLFTPFTQLDSSLTREYEGTGLGLVLVYKMTELHGGSMQVESEVGTGSRFTVILPWNEVETAEPFAGWNGSAPVEVAQIQASTMESHGIILVADDNEPNILVINDYLLGHGYQVVVAQNGLEALEKAQAVSPDLILMDIQMPEMDGLEAIRQLRLNQRFASTPIIALTALAMPGDREHCLAAGANEYMSKPVSLKMLVGTIITLLKLNS